MALPQFGIRLFLISFTFSIGAGAAWLFSLPSRGALLGEIKNTAMSPASHLGQPTTESIDPPPYDTPLPRKFPNVWDSQTTAAGQLEIVENDFLDWKVTLNGKGILSEAGELPPHILTRIQKRIPPYDEVVVLTGEGGTCCEITRFWFLGLRADGSHFLSKKIEAGWVEEPHITVGKDYVKAKIKGGPENGGWGYLPGGVWIFQNRTVRKVK